MSLETFIESSHSNEAEGKGVLLTPNFEAEVKEGEITFSWLAVTEFVSALESRTTSFYRLLDGVTEELLHQTESPEDVTGTISELGYGTSISVKLVAVAVDEEEEYILEIKAAEVFFTQPSTPLNLVAEELAGGVRLRWDSVLLEEDEEHNKEVTHYRIYRSTTQGSGYEVVDSILKENTTFIDDTVVDDTVYYYVVTSAIEVV